MTHKCGSCLVEVFRKNGRGRWPLWCPKCRADPRVQASYQANLAAVRKAKADARVDDLMRRLNGGKNDDTSSGGECPESS